jgi:hypothetical protein
MTHSLDLGPEAGVNSTLATLRLLDRSAAPIARGETLVPGIFLDFDPEGGVEAMVHSTPDTLFSAEFTVTGDAGWLALHIALGEIDLSQHMMFGFICKSMAPQSTTLRPCLRSGTAEGFSDIFFRKTIITYAEPSLHLDALMIDEHADLNVAAPWRELVLFFRPESGSYDLQDLRVFMI